MKPFCFLIIAIVSVWSCQTVETSYSPKGPEGVWESIGYGRLLVVDSSEYALYNTTKSSCVPFKSGSLSGVRT